MAPTRRRALLALILLVSLPAPTAAQPEASAPPPLHPGVSEMDLTVILARLARGDASVLELVAPLHGAGGKLRLPDEMLDAVLAPPPLQTTLAALVRANPGAAADVEEVERSLHASPLPPEVALALSSLGQGAVGAQALVAAGQPMAGAALLQLAVEHARGPLERHAILHAHPEAFGRTSRDEAYTHAHLAGLLDARDARAAAEAMGVRAAPPVEALPLSSGLAELYARLGLPLDRESRLALAMADGLDPSLREPLELALAHVLAAMAERDAALAALGPADLAALDGWEAASLALASPSPAREDLATLAAYGGAVQLIDAPRMAAAQGHLLSAADALALARDAQMPVWRALPCCAQRHGDEPARGFTVGGLTVVSSGGDVGLVLGPGAPTFTLPAANASFDPERGSLLVGRPGEALLRTPALADPDRDVVFQDPYGLVVVTGPGSSYVDVGGRAVRVDATQARLPSPDPGPALDLFDALLANETNAWPAARTVLASLEDAHVRRGEVRVNPAGYHVLRLDLGGDDHHVTNAGGAGERGLLTLRADGAGAMVEPTALREPIPAALLVDLAGNDTYRTRDAHTLASANRSVALLVDAGGRDAFVFRGERDGLASATQGGIAMLLAGHGSSRYEARDRAIAHASAAGTALLVDVGGDDAYAAGNASLTVSDLGIDAALLDLAGDDAYVSANFTQAASRGGVAVLADAQGNDSYQPLRDTSQGFTEPSGPARIALLLDAGGRDRGACDQGRLSNGALGFIGLARWPLRPYEPAFGACLDADAAPTAAGLSSRDAVLRIPPTYFASSFGNFTLPGLARFGTLGDDDVNATYVLQVDLAGNETYRVGAVATLNATRAQPGADMGYVGPVSLLLDFDGQNTFDAARGTGLGGAFAYANGGVALEGTYALRRAGPPPDDALTNRSRLAFSAPVNAYLNVTTGLAAAENGGVALHLSDGYASLVGDAGPGCRLACARSGGAAFWLSDGGPGDRVTATPLSLGAVEDNPQGGIAVYARRGPRDQYSGSNESMGVVLGSQAVAATPLLQPAVALFVKDGFAYDAYDATMRAPGLARGVRGNNLSWEDNETFSSWEAGARSMRVGRGIDNLDWYLHMNLATAERDGLAPGAGPGSPFHAAGPWGATGQRDPTASLPARVPGADHGDGRSTTGPEGLRPVTLARTLFSPVVNVTLVKAAGPAVPPSGLTKLAGNAFFTLVASDPPTYADQTDRTPGASRDGEAISRVEIAVRGTGTGWRGCPWPEKTDRIDPDACLIAYWDREEHPFDGLPPGAPSGIRRRALDTWDVQLNTAASAPNGAPAFPPGPYAVSLRAYAARTTNTTPLLGGDDVLESLASDAVNLTDDNYGYYGSAYHIAVPIYNAPRILGPRVIRDANATAPLTYDAVVTEPVEFTATIATRRLSEDDPPVRTVAVLTGRSRHYGNESAFFENGSDELNLTWNASAHADGAFTVTLAMKGKLSGERSASYVDVVFKDSTPPRGLHDPAGIPSVIGADAAPSGRFRVPVTWDPDARAQRTAPITVVHLYAQETVLDAADGSRVLEERPWRYVGPVTSLGQIRSEDGEREWLGVPFDGESRRGPPRLYRFAAVPQDRAGNRAVEDVANWTPTGTECEGGACAALLYDIAPPRTRAALVEPAPEVGRIREGSVRVRIDASESPDVTGVRAYGTVVEPGAPATLEAALAGVDLSPAPPHGANVTFGLAPQPTSPDLPLAGDPFALRLNLTSADKALFWEERPLWLRVRLLDATAAPATEDALVNVTELAPGIVPGTTMTLALPLVAPPRPGLYLAEVGVHPVEPDVNVTGGSFRLPLVAWDAVGEAGGNATWALPANATHGAQAFLLARGTDRVGNVEAKLDYDVRVDVDLAPPRLVGNVTVSPTATGATLAWETDEPALATVRVPGGPNATEEGPASTAHRVVLEGLAPETTYAVEVELRDALGNHATLRGPGFAFRTGQILDVELRPLPSLVHAPTPIEWVARNVTAADVEYRVLLSLDDGRTFPYDVTAPLRLEESGDQARAVPLDPARFAESPAARVRVEAMPAGRPELATRATTPPFVLDARPPDLTVTASGGLARPTNGSVRVWANATDGASGPATLEWSLDGQAFTRVEDAFDLTADAPVEVLVRARDGAGNVAPTQRLRLLFDRAEPHVSLDAPRLASGAAVPLQVHAGDALSGLGNVTLQDEAGAWNATLAPEDFLDGMARVLWPLAGPDGPRVLTAIARDAAGNAAFAVSNVTVDRRAPHVAGTLASRGVASAVVAIESDERARVEAILLGPDGPAPLLRVDGLRQRHVLPLFDLEPGTSYTVRLRVRDEAGNVAEDAVRFATLPDTSPPAGVTDLRATRERSGVVTLRWSEPEDDVGVVAYRVLRREPGGDWRDVARTDAPFFVDDASPVGMVVEHAVRALDASGNAGPSSSFVALDRRTPPTLTNVTLVPDGDAVRVRGTLRDVDGDAPHVVVHAQGSAFPATAVREGDAWIVEARIPAGTTRLGEARGAYLVARDGAFETREPPAGEYRLPLLTDVEEGGIGLLGARTVPGLAPVILLLAAALLALGVRRG